MIQEGYFEEALKMRNALQEFAKREGPLPTTILGFREHIFTGSISFFANYMALQETSFVTLGQRVLANLYGFGCIMAIQMCSTNCFS
jgi:callose synthase